MLKGLNHITVAVSDLDTSFQFYVDLLGMKPEVKWDRGAYLTAGDLWFCLSLDKALPASDYSHIALNIDKSDYATYQKRLLQSGVELWKENSSEGDSLYILDPDGHKLELHVGNLASRLESLKQYPYQGLTWY